MQCHGPVSQLGVGPGQVSSLPSVLGSTFCALVEGGVGDGMDAQEPSPALLLDAAQPALLGEGGLGLT